MNIKVHQSEEDLSDVLLDEHASVSKVKKSPKLLKDMSRELFVSELKMEKSQKAFSSPVDTASFCESTQASPPRKSLQGDIKFLLHQAMKIRKSSDPNA